MKIALLLMTIMLLSIFASSNSLANLDLDSSVDVGLDSREKTRLSADVSAELDSDDDSDDKSDDDSDDDRDDSKSRVYSDVEVRRELANIDSSVSLDARETSFAEVNRGSGWITGNSSGRFLTILWVEKEFENETDENVRASGIIKINSEPAYKINLVSDNEETKTFSVTSNARDVNGTLVLHEEQDLSGFVVWSGKLEISDKSYDVSLATIEGRARGGMKALYDSELKTKVKLDSDVELSQESQETLKELRESLDSRVIINIDADKEGDNVNVESEVKGTLTADQEALLNELKEQISETLDSVEGSAELELEIKSETKASKGWKRLLFWRR